MASLRTTFHTVETRDDLDARNHEDGRTAEAGNEFLPPAVALGVMKRIASGMATKQSRDDLLAEGRLDSLINHPDERVPRELVRLAGSGARHLKDLVSKVYLRATTDPEEAWNPLIDALVSRQLWPSDEEVERMRATMEGAEEAPTFQDLMTRFRDWAEAGPTQDELDSLTTFEAPHPLHVLAEYGRLPEAFVERCRTERPDLWSSLALNRFIDETKRAELLESITTTLAHGTPPGQDEKTEPGPEDQARAQQYVQAAAQAYVDGLRRTHEEGRKELNRQMATHARKVCTEAMAELGDPSDEDPMGGLGSQDPKTVRALFLAVPLARYSDVLDGEEVAQIIRRQLPGSNDPEFLQEALSSDVAGPEVWCELLDRDPGHWVGEAIAQNKDAVGNPDVRHRLLDSNHSTVLAHVLRVASPHEASQAFERLMATDPRKGLEVIEDNPALDALALSETLVQELRSHPDSRVRQWAGLKRRLSERSKPAPGVGGPSETPEESSRGMTPS